MNGDGIGFSEISDVHRNERRSKVLTKLPVNFYSRAEAHLQALRAECRAADPDPSNPKIIMLQDQISKLDKRLKQIYDIRERKIALAALDSMLGAPPPDNMTKADRALYDRLIGVLALFRKGGEIPAATECPPPSAAAVEQTPALETVTVPHPVNALDAPIPQPAAAEESIVVQVLEDIPTFVGVNVTYDLRKDELVTLPSQFANLLSSRGKVRKIGS